MYALTIALFLGSCLGHIAILSFSNNWWFSWALPHRLLTVVRLLHGALVVAGLAAFVRAYPLDFSLAEAISSGNASRIVATGYAVLCASVGLVLLPFITLVRRLKARPAILVSNDTQMRNIASDLGYKPVGKGKYLTLPPFPRN